MTGTHTKRFPSTRSFLFRLFRFRFRFRHAGCFAWHPGAWGRGSARRRRRRISPRMTRRRRRTRRRETRRRRQARTQRLFAHTSDTRRRRFPTRFRKAPPCPAAIGEWPLPDPPPRLRRVGLGRRSLFFRLRSCAFACVPDRKRATGAPSPRAEVPARARRPRRPRRRRNSRPAAARSPAAATSRAPGESGGDGC